MKNPLVLLLVLLSCSAYALSDTTSVETEMTEEEYQALIQQYLDSVESTLVYEHGEVEIGDGVATITVPDGYKYLNGESSDMIITDIWGNPPPQKGDESLGMLVPADKGALADSAYQINITYSQEGYIKDDEAANLDYDDLLESMRADEDAMNEYRTSEGYPTMHLVGWAAEPHYDAESNKLYWAKEIEFGGDPNHTLNYNIRVLGRRGYLQLNAIGEMYVLPQVEREIDGILSNVNFTEGNRYTDFNPDMDKVAAYGIGGLIAGKVLAKAGILAKLGILLAKFWKVILLGIVGLGAGVKKFFGKGEEASQESAGNGNEA